MAVCDYCGLEMTLADGCIDQPIMIEGWAYRPVRHGDELDMKEVTNRCHDCAVLPGEVHHPGCDMEQCPACGEQSIGCDCIWDGEEPLSEEWLEAFEKRFLRSGVDQ